MKIVKIIFKRLVVSVGIIYSLNLLLNGYNVFIPLNFANILIGSLLGPLGIGTLIIIFLIVM